MLPDPSVVIGQKPCGALPKTALSPSRGELVRGILQTGGCYATRFYPDGQIDQCLFCGAEQDVGAREPFVHTTECVYARLEAQKKKEEEED